MVSNRSIVEFFLSAFLASFALHFATAESFPIAAGGKAACTLVTAARPTPSARLAALELQHHLRLITGADIPIQTEAEAPTGPRILVGESAATRALGFRSADFAGQEYQIAFRSNAVVLLGRDWEDTPENRKIEGRPMTGDSLQSLRHRVDYWKTVGHPERSQGEIELPGLYDDQGTCLATYDFLERFAGVRWYGPAPLHVITPSQPDLTVNGADLRRSPGLKHRSALPGGNWPFLRGQWGEFNGSQLQLFWRRLRQGGERWSANHTFHRATIQSTFTAPEYQSKNPKSQGSQLCYSSPELVQKVAQMARDHFDGKGGLPEGWKALGEHFSLVPDDNLNLCNCPRCEAALAKGKPRKTGFFSDGQISDYWFGFVNAVAREVRKTHPDKFISTLGYWAYAQPPEFPMEPNVSVAPCLHTCYFPVHAGMRDNDLTLYRDWQQRSSGPMFMWVYYHHPMEPALIQRWKCFPHVMVHDTAKAMRQFVRDGVRGIFECGEQDQLEQYVMARVWDDPETDVDAVIAEFFRNYFGPAGEPMRRFYLRLEQIATDPANYPTPYSRRDGIDWKKVAWERLGTAERMAELGGLIAQADQAATAEPFRQRFVLWRTALWDWMQQGRQEYLASQAPKTP